MFKIIESYCTECDRHIYSADTEMGNTVTCEECSDRGILISTKDKNTQYDTNCIKEIVKCLKIEMKEIENTCDGRVDGSSRCLTEHSKRIQWLEDKVLQRLNANVSVLSKQAQEEKDKE